LARRARARAWGVHVRMRRPYFAPEVGSKCQVPVEKKETKKKEREEEASEQGEREREKLGGGGMQWHEEEYNT